MRNAIRNHEHVPFGQMLNVAANDFLSQRLAGTGDGWFNRPAAGHNSG